MEDPGIDPGTSRMLSERSTIWASPPTHWTMLNFNSTTPLIFVCHYYYGNCLIAVLPYPIWSSRRRRHRSRWRLFISFHCHWFHLSLTWFLLKLVLPGGESNPGLPRDRRGYSPLYYRGLNIKSCEWDFEKDYEQLLCRYEMQVCHMIHLVFTSCTMTKCSN